MSTRKIFLSVLASGLALGVAMAPAADAKRKPVKKTYTATAVRPDPTNYVPEPAGHGQLCHTMLPDNSHRHVHTLKVPASGKLEVKMTGFVGDWDLVVADAKGKNLAESGELPGTDERILYKMKKPGTLQIWGCNWAGGPTATVSYTFTFDK